MLRLITLAALFGNYEVAGFYDSSPIVPMKDYSKDYRTLDCSECIQAEGKMCGKKDGSGAIAVNGSSNQGHGICCKPDNVTDSHCKDEGDYICSAPIMEADNDAKWKNIMTAGKNMQLSAYCPLIQPEKCGLTGGSHDIDATTKGKISLIGDTAIKAKSGTIKSGQYDSCYYQLTAPAAKAGQSIEIKVTKLKDMNVYFYGGKTRAEATISVVEDNAQLELGKSYYTTVENGGLLTALPSLNKPTTEFEFEYSVTETPSSSSMPMIIGIAVGVCAVLIILCAVMKIRQNKKENTVQVLAQESVDEPTSNLNGKENADDMNTIELNKADGDK